MPGRKSGLLSCQKQAKGLIEMTGWFVLPRASHSSWEDAQVGFRYWSNIQSLLDFIAMVQTCQPPRVSCGDRRGEQKFDGYLRQNSAAIKNASVFKSMLQGSISDQYDCAMASQR